ncbi:MAG: AAA family ATPase, partial [Chitinivibrionales bacterium]|nr:AAA family ATPase [Chitinivibrionales bacterium]
MNAFRGGGGISRSHITTAHGTSRIFPDHLHSTHRTSHRQAAQKTMHYYADLHIHSPYSRATSRELTLENLAVWAQRKGVQLVGTGDCIHPAWLDTIEDALEPSDDGFLALRDDRARAVSELVPPACSGMVRFVLTVEISNIYKRLDKVRKVHNLVVLPSIDAARRLQARLDAIGNIRSDGRPILGLDSRDLLEIVLECGDGAFLIPAHIWTPWFSALGSKGGFDRLADCYADLTEHIFAVETGLSSDPPMNRRLSQLDPYVLVSHSDAHSPSKLAREATEFDTELSYEAMLRALADRNDRGLVGTVEFFPEEGKYHLDGHRACGVRLSPAETNEHHGRCPSCGRLVTVGVMARVEALADRPAGEWSERWRPFTRCVPLPEILGQVRGKGPATKGVLSLYETMLDGLGSELFILRHAPLEAITTVGGELTREAVARMRRGEVETAAGYDGEFGTVTVLPDDIRARVQTQVSLFGLPTARKRTKSDGQPSRTPMPDGGLPYPALVAEERPEGREPARETGSARARLNRAQREAVEYDGARLVIVAGPGTGKTHTLTHRIARVAQSLGDSQSVIAVTFTNRAAAEMRDRLARLAPQSLDRMVIGTFHRVCLDLLREFQGEMSLPAGFGVAAGQECERIARTVWPDRGTRERREALGEVSAWKSSAPLDAAVPESVVAYDRALRNAGLVDFDDLIRETLRLLSKNHQVRAAVQARTMAVFVDEYQDIDSLQAALLEELVGESVHLTVIGDPDQSIYGFRGSTDAVFGRFERSFPDAHRVHLTQSYRAGQSLLSACTQVIARGRPDDVPSLSPVVRLRGRLTIREAPTDKAEAEYVVHQVERLVGGTGMFSHDSGRVASHGQAERSFGDIAVLYRLNSQQGMLREAFERSGIPFQVSGDAPLAAQPPVPELLALLRLAGGHAVPRDAVRELLENAAPGVGPKAARRIVAGETGVVTADELRCATGELPDRLRAPLRDFLVTVEGVAARMNGSVSEVIRFVESRPGWVERLGASRTGDTWQRLRRHAA